MRSFIILMCVFGVLAGLATMLRDGVSGLVLCSTICAFCSGIYLSSYEGGICRMVEMFFISIGVFVIGCVVSGAIVIVLF